MCLQMQTAPRLPGPQWGKTTSQASLTFQLSQQLIKRQQQIQWEHQCLWQQRQQLWHIQQ